MSVRVAKSAGFCFGVSRAVELVEKAAAEGKKVVTLGPIIHNRHVVARFRDLGVSVIDRPEDAPAAQPKRVFFVRHTTEQVLEEFLTVIDLGGRILDVAVEHELYGPIRADLLIENVRDAEEFVERLKLCRDNPLKVLTDDCHFHTVSAPSEKLLDLIEAELRERGFLER
jgi:transcriptional regulator of NAD metabolism